jgi:hypothetical protein
VPPAGGSPSRLHPLIPSPSFSDAPIQRIRHDAAVLVVPMTRRALFNTAKQALSVSFERKTSLCDPFLLVIPVTGAAVSFFGTGQAQTVISASSARAAELDELQFDLGEGPGWEAIASGRPALHPDLPAEHTSLWPEFSAAIGHSDIGALYAFPLAVSSLNFGAVDLYSTYPRELSAEEIAEGVALAQVAAWQVLRRVLMNDEADLHPGYSRREIHQATGMVIAQLDVTADDAALLLRAHAFSSGRAVRDIANDIVERRLMFSNEIGPKIAPVSE